MALGAEASILGLMRLRARAAWSFAAVVALATAAGCGSDGNAKERLGIDRSADTAELGYCRTRTCPPPARYPLPGACEPEDWTASETCTESGASGAPLWWRSACVGWTLDEAASRRVTFDDFANAATNAFASWTTATCATASPGERARVSLDARYLGAVACSRATYDRSGPNQNVITFHDDVWPHGGGTPGFGSPVIALTTVSFDPESGEIVDADIEINSADHVVVPVDSDHTPPPRAFDLQAVLTHEVGHFLGLAHSPDVNAVMASTDDPDTGGREPKRALRDVDEAGICAIYPPGGRRNVSTLVAGSGVTPAGVCDATPRRGLASTCDGS